MQQKDSLAYWRARIFFTIIFSGLLLTFPAVVASVFIALKDQIWHLVVFNVTGFIFACMLLFAKRPRYQIRATIVLFLFYIVGLYVTLIMGLLSGGPAWLFAFAVMMGVLLGAVMWPLVAVMTGNVALALAVSVAILGASTVATVVALCLPWLLHRLGKDPAFGSGPLATVVQDLLSILLYFAAVSVFLG